MIAWRYSRRVKSDGALDSLVAESGCEIAVLSCVLNVFSDHQAADSPYLTAG